MGDSSWVDGKASDCQSSAIVCDFLFRRSVFHQIAFCSLNQGNVRLSVQIAIRKKFNVCLFD